MEQTSQKTKDRERKIRHFTFGFHFYLYRSRALAATAEAAILFGSGVTALAAVLRQEVRKFRQRRNMTLLFFPSRLPSRRP